jgi:UMF1 family MFS transporter
MSGAREGYPPRRAVVSWIFFDWAAQPFFTLITTFVFAPYFASALASDPARGQALWGYATAAAGLVIALSSPVLGAIADAVGPKKPWIVGFGLLLITGASALWLAAPGAPAAVSIALVAFVVASIGTEFATVFNNAMMPRLVPPDRLGWLSGAGWATGYIGGIVSLVITLGFLAGNPDTGRTLFGLTPAFGLDPVAREGDRITGPLTALWFIVFVAPMLIFTPDAPRSRVSLQGAAGHGLAALAATVREVRRYRVVVRFLIANMVYQDGLVALFAFGGIYGAGMFGWTTIELGVFGILLTIAGTIGAFIGGKLDDVVGGKPVAIGCLVVLVACCIGILSLGRDTVLFVIPAAPPTPNDGLFASLPERVYLGFGLIIGLVAGPLQSASRSLLVRLAPQEHVGQFFGLFALSGKATSFVAPLLVALVTDLAGHQSAALFVLIAFFGTGAMLLAGVATSRRAPDQGA